MAPPQIEVLEDDLIKIHADVCVSSIHRSKEMTRGPLASYIGEKGGKSVQAQLSAISRELTHGEVVKTDPGNLDQFKFLLFCCLYTWREGNDAALCDVVRECCEMASKDNAKSICFPCLGTGGQKYPVAEAATAMMEGIVDFMTNNAQTSLERIVIVLPIKDAEWLKTFVYICAKTVHMYNKGSKSTTEGELFDVLIHDYERIRNTPTSRRSGRDRGVRDKGAGGASSNPGQSLTSLTSFQLGRKEYAIGPFNFIGDSNVNLRRSGVDLTVRFSVDVPILETMFSKILSFFGVSS